MKEEVVEYFKSLQDSICIGLEKLDGKVKFHEDLWQRDGGGGGRTRVIQGGDIFEKGGVNFSEVFGKAPEFLSKEPAEFFASGVSIVIHPRSPMVPIIHMNVRYIETAPSPMGRAGGGVSWFGGGIDLTPIYVVKEDAQYFHQSLKAACSRFHPDFYRDFKKWADDYFFIPHRNETRGVGGIFFDHLGKDPERSKISDGNLFEFVQAVGNTFLPIYTHLVKKNKDLPFTDKEKKWQLLRRGRYAEFNLVYDRGTKFGLQTNGRTESILMSLPPEVNWDYDVRPEANSSEAATVSLLKKDVDWAS